MELAVPECHFLMELTEPMVVVPINIQVLQKLATVGVATVQLPSPASGLVGSPSNPWAEPIGTHLVPEEEEALVV